MIAASTRRPTSGLGMCAGSLKSTTHSVMCSADWVFLISTQQLVLLVANASN